jgi:hypothetical protein
LQNLNILSLVTNLTFARDLFLQPRLYYSIKQRDPAQGFCKQENMMKLSLISATIIAYTVLAAAWLCYAELTSAFRTGAPF